VAIFKNVHRNKEVRVLDMHIDTFSDLLASQALHFGYDECYNMVTITRQKDYRGSRRYRVVLGCKACPDAA